MSKKPSSYQKTNDKYLISDAHKDTINVFRRCHELY